MSKFNALLLVLTFAVASLSLNAAAYTTQKKSVISIDPLDLLVSKKISATFETKFSGFGGKKNSLTFNASYWNFADYQSAIGLGASYRWYIDLFEEGKTALNGFSLGPRLEYYYWTYDYVRQKGGNWPNDNWSTFAIGAEINYKFAFNKNWVVEPNVKFMFPILKESGYAYTNYGVGVNLGYAF